MRVVSGNTPSAGREDKTKTDNKTKMIAMRFRESDYAAIKRKAEKANMNFTEFVTAVAINKPITVINGLEDVLKEQKAIGRNLNQLTTLCNMGKIEQLQKLGYGVKWIDHYKYITYTTPDGQRFRDNRLLDDKYLKNNMEELFAYEYRAIETNQSNTGDN